MKELNLSPNQIYNADEPALFWKLLPDKTLARSKEKTAPGPKTSKVRVTFLLCINADGSQKLNLKFKNVQIPVEYKATKNSWMALANLQNGFISRLRNK